MLVNLAPRHRRPLARLLERAAELTPQEAAVALELVDDALTHPASTSYRFLLWTSREPHAGPEGQRAREGAGTGGERHPAESAPAQGAETIGGYVCFGATPMTEMSFDLYWLVVDPAFRRRGIGRALVSGAEEAIREAGGGVVRVETAGTEAYAPARRLYERMAYSPVGRISDFYSPGNDLWILTKDLRRLDRSSAATRP